MEKLSPEQKFLLSIAAEKAGVKSVNKAVKRFIKAFVLGEGREPTANEIFFTLIKGFML